MDYAVSSDFLSSDLVTISAHGVDIDLKCFIINYALY